MLILVHPQAELYVDVKYAAVEELIAQGLCVVLVRDLEIGLEHDLFFLLEARLTLDKLDQPLAVRILHNEGWDVNRGSRTVILAPAIMPSAMFHYCSRVICNKQSLSTHVLHIPCLFLERALAIPHNHEAIPLHIVPLLDIVSRLHVSTGVLLHRWEEKWRLNGRPGLKPAEMSQLNLNGTRGPLKLKGINCARRGHYAQFGRVALIVADIRLHTSSHLLERRHY